MSGWLMKESRTCLRWANSLGYSSPPGEGGPLVPPSRPSDRRADECVELIKELDKSHTPWCSPMSEPSFPRSSGQHHHLLRPGILSS